MTLKSWSEWCEHCVAVNHRPDACWLLQTADHTLCGLCICVVPCLWPLEAAPPHLIAHSPRSWICFALVEPTSASLRQGVSSLPVPSTRLDSAVLDAD